MKIGLKVVIILLVVALYFVIDIPAGIREVEKEVFEKSRNNLTILFEAERYYKRKTRKYTDNFDTLRHFIETDTLLQNKIKVVHLTKELIETIDSYIDLKEDAFTSSMFKVKQSSEIIVNLLDEIKDEYRSTPEISQLAEELHTLLSSLNDDDDYTNFNNVVSNIDSIFTVKIDINSFKLQKAVHDVISFSEYVMSNMENMETKEYKNIWLGVSKDIERLSALMNAPDMKPQNKTNRLQKQTGIIQENLDRLITRSISDAKTELQKKHGMFVSVRDNFSNSENFELTKRNGKPSLEESEQLISQLNENTIMAPPLKNTQYKMELEQRGFKISCPNEPGEISVNGIFTQYYKNYGYVTNQGKSWD